MRELFEAVALHALLMHLSALLRYQLGDIDSDNASTKARLWLKHKGRSGVLQYFITRLCTVPIAIACDLKGAYGEGKFDFRYAWIYLQLINSISLVFAMVNIGRFYRQTKPLLNQWHPLRKFASIKLFILVSNMCVMLHT